MGTRSLTYIYNQAEMPLVCIYRQYDGYPAMHGAELAELLTETKHNGIECLSASVISKLKTGWGNVYLYPPFAEQDAGQEWEYVIQDDLVSVYHYNIHNERLKLFEGYYDEFKAYCNNIRSNKQSIERRMYENSIV